LNKGILTVGAGVTLYKLNAFCIGQGLSGLEFSFGIPGTVGGALVMNAGAYGGQMSDVVSRVYYTDGEKVYAKTNNLVQFGYRTSCFLHSDFVILKATFNMKKGSSDVEKKCKENLQKRVATQPYNQPSAGSVFKRPASIAAPILIEQCGLKGKTVGGAQISDVHCGFIVNKGGAKASDVLKLISEIERTVYKKFGIMLDREIIILK
jgi:UDP-N-acetylmuramate dehydrogenase